MATITQLNRGLSGAAVSAMQQDLLALGFKLPQYGADGDFGAETEKAVKDFQYTYGITVDGIVGPQTAAAIKEALNLLAEERWNPSADPLQYPGGIILAAPSTPLPITYPTPIRAGVPALVTPQQASLIPSGGINLPILGTVPWSWILVGGFSFLIYLFFFKGKVSTGRRRRYVRNEPDED